MRDLVLRCDVQENQKDDRTYDFSRNNPRLRAKITEILHTFGAQPALALHHGHPLLV